jgi:hypothetical protein
LTRNPHTLHISQPPTDTHTNTLPQSNTSHSGSTFAATSATEAEEEIARKGKHPDGSTPVKVTKRAWRPKIKTVYEEPEDILDTSGELDWLFEENGKVMTINKNELPARNDLITYDPQKHADEIDKNIQWRDCPEKHRGVLRAIIEKFFDVFAQEGMQKPIRGFEFNIDTGTVKPICCKPPQYGHHERRVILTLVEQLEKKNIIEDDDGPWGSPIVLASKPNQDHVHWSQFVFRLCVSYRALNGITRPFTFPVTRCDEAVDRVGDAKYVITMDLDAGYWQVSMNQASRPKSAFFIPGGKKRFRSMPMGATNAHAVFVAMVCKFETKWDALYEHRCHKQKEAEWAWLKDKMKHEYNKSRPKHATTPEPDSHDSHEEKNWEPKWDRPQTASRPGSAVIVDDILLFARTAAALLYYLICVLETLQHHRVTVKLRKTRFFPGRAEFVGIDILPDGNSPAKSKYEAIEELERPELFTDLRMLIGFIGFYRDWIPLYEERIGRWREHMKQAPAPGECDKDDEASIMRQLWEQQDDQILDDLKQAILTGPVLKRPEPNRRFYLKTDWSAHAQGAVLLQAGCTKAEEEAVHRETKGGQCEFEKKLSGLRLRPVAFISQRRKEPSSRHSFVGEAATGRWAMLKFKRHLIGREFTWITDCSGLLKFFDTEYEATHTIQRWKLELLRFDFTIVHRPGKMLTDCDMLSRYNTWCSEWRIAAEAVLAQLTKEEELTRAQLTREDELTHTKTAPIETPRTLLNHTEHQESVTTYDKWRAKQDSLGQHPKPQTLKDDLSNFCEHTDPSPIPRSHINPKVTGAKTDNRTLMAETCDKARTIWIIGQGAETATAAMTELGLEPITLRATDETEYWRDHGDVPTLETLLTRLQRQQQTTAPTEPRPEWIIVPRAQDFTNTPPQTHVLTRAIQHGKQQGSKAAILIWTTTHRDTERQQAKDMAATLNDIGWDSHIGELRNEEHEGYLEGRSTYMIAGPSTTIQRIKDAKTSKANDSYSKLDDILDDSDGIFEDCFRYHENTTQDTRKPENTHGARTKTTLHVQLRPNDPTATQTVQIFNAEHPGPNLTGKRHAIGDKAFAIEATDGITRQKARPIRNHELLAAMGYDTDTTKALTNTDHEWRQVFDRLADTAPRHTWEPLFATLFLTETQLAEERVEALWTEREEQTPRAHDELDRTRTLVARVINRWTTLPVPTETTWQTATQHDHDLRIVLLALQTDTDLEKATLIKKQYHTEWKEGRLEHENGIVYQLEVPKATKIRQLRRKIVPTTLQATILAAYHATPLAGHTGVYKTYWRIAARYWWPGMSVDIRKAVLDCGFCRVANATSHGAQQIIGALSTDEPFDIISMDVWHPGTTTPTAEGGKFQKAVLTCLCNMTGFASLAFVSQFDSNMMARLAFSHFFVPNGLPKLVLIDEDSTFKGELMTICDILGVRYLVVAPEEHNAILCERFHRYLNKVQRIGVADAQSYEKWKMNSLFASYAWNASPIDGTDIIRSFAAKARTFHFPLDIQLEDEIARIPQEGEAALQHIETMFPLWWRQKELLRLINDERRARHRERSNRHKTKRTFQPGDIVIVRKQVNSNAAEGKPAKLTLRAKGPYRILEEAGENSYYVQKIPAIQSLTKRLGKRRKELAMRMEKLPSSIVIHKRVDTMDTRLSQLDGPLADNPLEKNLGFFDFGKYTLAPDDANFAYVKVNEMWNEPIEAQMNSDDDTEDSTDEEDNAVLNDAPDSPTEQGPSKRRKTQRKEQKRTRESETAPTPRKRVKIIAHKTTKEYLKELWNEIQASTDKLFFIKRQDPRTQQTEWHLIQIDPDETDPQKAKRLGEYHARYYIREYENAKKRRVMECRFWPLIRELRADGNFGAIVMIRPNKVDEILAKKQYTRGWYQHSVNIAEDGVVGPFNFDTISGEANRIEPKYWTELLEAAKEYDIYALDVKKITPIPG